MGYYEAGQQAAFLKLGISFIGGMSDDAMKKLYSQHGAWGNVLDAAEKSYKNTYIQHGLAGGAVGGALGAGVGYATGDDSNKGQRAAVGGALGAVGGGALGAGSKMLLNKNRLRGVEDAYARYSKEVDDWTANPWRQEMMRRSGSPDPAARGATWAADTQKHNDMGMAIEDRLYNATKDIPKKLKGWF